MKQRPIQNGISFSCPLELNKTQTNQLALLLQSDYIFFGDSHSKILAYAVRGFTVIQNHINGSVSHHGSAQMKMQVGKLKIMCDRVLHEQAESACVCGGRVGVQTQCSQCPVCPTKLSNICAVSFDCMYTVITYPMYPISIQLKHLALHAFKT